MRQLTDEETAVVRAYAASHGRCWKRDLRDAWYHAAEPGILQALRNELGPTWLDAYKFPPIKPTLKPEAVVVSAGWTNRYHMTALPAWQPMPERDKTADDEATRAEMKASSKRVPFWSGKGLPPAIGSRVIVGMNGFGGGTVRAYLIEYGYLGVEVELDKRPAWHVKQNGNEHAMPMVFGAELNEEKR